MALDNSKYATMQNARGFLQFGGARPQNKVFFYDKETNAFTISGVSDPVTGGRSPINVAGARPGVYRRAGETVDPADFPSFSLSLREQLGKIPKALVLRGCPITVYEARGECKSLANFDQGWSSMVYIYSGAKVDERSPGDRTSHDGSDAVETELSMTADAVYPVGQILGANKNTSGITLEINDVIYGNNEVCGDCGPADDGTQRIYAAEKGGAAAKPIVHYSLDGGATWSTSSISTAANAEAIAKLGIMGSYIVALSATANTATRGGYYYATLNPLTGAPGTWTKVTTGFTDTYEPRDMVVLGPREAYICTDSGEILTITDVPSGATSLGIVTTSDLGRISAYGNTIVAVGASGAVMRSINRGRSFAAVTTAPSANTATAIEVVGEQRFYVGDSAGGVFYTENAGETAWPTITTGATMAAVQDIRFATPEVGYIAYTISGTLARVAATINGGASWSLSDMSGNQRLQTPTTSLQRYNRIAIPETSDWFVNANNVIFGGLGATTDGTLVLGTVATF